MQIEGYAQVKLPFDHQVLMAAKVNAAMMALVSTDHCHATYSVNPDGSCFGGRYFSTESEARRDFSGRLHSTIGG